MSLKSKGYLKDGSRRFDSLAAGLGLVGIIAALGSVTKSVQMSQLFDPTSFVFVALGTISVIFVQYDLKTLGRGIWDLFESLMPLKIHQLKKQSSKLDELVERRVTLRDVPHDGQLSGDILRDAAVFYSKGMTFEEIDEIIASRVVTELKLLRRSAEVFFRAAQLAPALGLLGTIVGLVGVLRSLGDPSQIGGAMSLALMTTAYGSVIGSLVCSPASGRIEACADNYAHLNRELLRKIRILYLRAEADVKFVRKPGARA